MRRTITTLAMTGFLCIGGATAALAASNPSPTGTGPPNQSCQAQYTAGGHGPGNSAFSPGSVFNEKGFFGSTTGGTGGNAYNSAGKGGLGAPSQYDVACYQVNQPHP